MNHSICTHWSVFTQSGVISEKGISFKMRSLCLKTLLIVVCIVHCTLATLNEDQSLPRNDFHASSSSSAQSYAIIKHKYDYTKTDIIKSWTENMSPSRPVYSKEFVLKVVGKRVKAFNKLKLNNVVKMNKVQLKIFYGRQLLDNLEKTFEFIVAMYSTIDVIEEGQLEEYPSQNLYPPYWKHIKNMRHGDKDLALRALILDQPRKFSVKNGTVKEEWYSSNCRRSNGELFSL
uniref:Uncharacterized protein n=1 Tax=Ditylenchus dipsaci TaxID=166011 RepID=A0A915DX30_9BILA